MPTTTPRAPQPSGTAFCDHLVVLRAGRVVAAGPPSEVLTEDLVADVYGVRAWITTEDGRPHVRFLGVSRDRPDIPERVPE